VPHIQLAVPAGALTEEGRTAAREALARALARWAAVPGEEYFRTPSWFRLRELPQSTAGEDGPYFEVDVTVPAGTLDDESRTGLAKEITERLTAAAGLEDGPRVRTVIHEPDGCYLPVDVVRTPDGDVDHELFLATPHVGSPWSPDSHQHGGPVSALLARAMDRCRPRPGTRLARVTVDLLGAVPLGPVRVSARVERPGRRVELLSAVMEAPAPDGRWRPVAQAGAWRMATQDTAEASHRADPSLPLPPADGDGRPDTSGLPESWLQGGFVSALEWRTGGGLVHRRGVPTVAWMRMTRPLVAGEAATPLERAVAIADVANGVGARLDPHHWTFLNTDLTVQLFEPPQGEWFGLQAETSVGPDGVGMGSAVLHQESGTLGRLTQSLLVERRPDHAG